MKLFNKGLLLVAVPGLFELILLGLLFKSQQDAARAEYWALHTKEVIIQASEVREPILLQSARLRKAIILHDTAEMEEGDLWATVEQEIGELEALVSDNRPQAANVKEIRALVQSYREWSDQQAELIRKNDLEPVIEAMRNNAGTVRRLTPIREKIAEFIRIEERMDAERLKRVVDARHSQLVMLMLALVGSVLAAAIAAWIFSRDVGGRLAILTGNARRLSDGGQLADRVGGDDEITELDAVLHQTYNRLTLAEKEATAYRAELEQHARELAQVNENLQRQTQDNEMFIYSVSHDLRSPLVNLQGFSKELNHAVRELHDTIAASALSAADKQRIQTLIEDDVEVSLKFIRTAVSRSASIIDAMLRLSRVGRVVYQPKLLDVDEIVGRVIDAMQATVRERNAQVIAAPLPPCHGDPTAVEQVFGNLIGNAVNYLDPTRPGLVEVGALPDDAATPHLHTYFVRDNGLGIPAAYIDRMFSAFHRLHADVAQGEGVGLALIKRIVIRHGGKIWVESVEGSGSTFFVSLPAQEFNEHLLIHRGETT